MDKNNNFVFDEPRLKQCIKECAICGHKIKTNNW
jgi:hypothetical protein